MSERIVVAGAGPAGLYAARRLVRLGRPVTVLEKEDVVGGLAARLARGGNAYSHGFHSFHDGDPAFLAEMREAAGERWREFRRDVAIQLRGRFHEYPLRMSGFFRGFSGPAVARGLAGFLTAAASAPFRSGPPRNAEEAIVRLYGRPLYREYFSEYTDRFWGRPAAAISPRFVEERLPRFDPLERLRSRRGRSGRAPARTTQIGRPVMATTTAGSGALFEALAADLTSKGGQVRTGRALSEVVLDGGRVSAVRVDEGGRTTEIPCDGLISTIPLPRLLERLRPAPPAEVAAAGAGLTSRGLLTAALLVARERVLPAGLTYFHGRIFHRLSEPKSSGVEVRPGNDTTLLAEVTADPSDRLWNDDQTLIERVVDEARAAGLLRPADVREAHVFKAPDAYPFFSLDYDRRLAAVRSFLGAIPNLVCTGRQGRFSFLRSAEAMKAAWADTEAAGFGRAS